MISIKAWYELTSSRELTVLMAKILSAIDRTSVVLDEVSFSVIGHFVHAVDGS